jgi:signal transduction histidine kinase
MPAWMQLDLGSRHGPLAALARRLGGRWGVIAAFLLTDILLQWLGNQLQERPTTPTVLWPASGFLFAVFWLTGRSWWLPLGALHVLIESFSLNSGGDWWSPTLIGCADVLDSAVGASLAMRWIKEPTQVRVYQVALFVVAAAISTGVGAVIGTAVSSSYLYPDMGYWSQMQLWWIGNWLGTVSFAPVVFVWVMSYWKSTPEVRLRSRAELLGFCLLLPLLSWYVFTTRAGDVGSVLQLPAMVFAALTLAAFRLPPRWAVTLAAMVVVMVAVLAVEQIGMFAVRETFWRMINVQSFLGTVAVLTFLLATAIAEMRVTTRHLRASEYRYRNFVELSSEAVWCVELAEPMPVSLPLEQMRDWLRRHGRITECSLSFSRLDPDDKPDRMQPLRVDSMWMDVYQRYLEEVAKEHFSCSDLQVSATIGGQPRTLLTSFDGVMEDGALVRIWGVARDITELTALNARLQREQERLRGYALALASAEERARRATAVDLHDGIGQSLAGMGMTLEVAQRQVPPEARLLLEEVKARLREVQERTGNMISDLSPPGLYELGLVPALNWLSVYSRGRDKFDMRLDCVVDESRIGMEMRVQVFKLVRELVRNVIKHSGVAAARVRVRGDAQSLCIEVADEGRGFHWNPDDSGSAGGGFGLWSIARRVADAGGEFRVESAPGQGARFELVLPLTPAGAGADRHAPRDARA